MFCTKCGKQINDGANFCTSCGQRVANEVQEQDRVQEAMYLMKDAAVGAFSFAKKKSEEYKEKQKKRQEEEQKKQEENRIRRELLAEKIKEENEQKKRELEVAGIDVHAPVVQQTPNNIDVENNPDESSVGLFLVGLFIPLAGLIVWLSLKGDKPKKAESAINGFWFNLFLNFIIYVIIYVSIKSALGY